MTLTHWAASGNATQDKIPVANKRRETCSWFDMAAMLVPSNTHVSDGEPPHTEVITAAM